MAVSTSSASSDLGHAQRERFRFMESSLMWEGAIRRQRVSTVFNVSLNHVTKDLRRYEAAYPKNIVFDHHRRLYVAGPGFKPHYASRDPGEYLALQLAHAESGSTAVTPLLGGWDAVSISTMPTPAHGIPEKVLRQLVRAISDETGVDVLYHSTGATEPGRRHLWPHALVHTIKSAKPFVISPFSG
jgi:predicted DNA-binding transcriptional regulator YafY